VTPVAQEHSVLQQVLPSVLTVLRELTADVEDRTAVTLAKQEHSLTQDQDGAPNVDLEHSPELNPQAVWTASQEPSLLNAAQKPVLLVMPEPITQPQPLQHALTVLRVTTVMPGLPHVLSALLGLQLMRRGVLRARIVLQDQHLQQDLLLVLSVLRVQWPLKLGQVFVLRALLEPTWIRVEERSVYLALLELQMIRKELRVVMLVLQDHLLLRLDLRLVILVQLELLNPTKERLSVIPVPLVQLPLNLEL